jgi:integrase
MATISFLFRSTKEEAPLTVRLLFRHNNTDFVYGTVTKVIVTKEYWTKHHTKKVKVSEILNKKIEINEELGKIQKFLMDSFDKAYPENVDKDWLVNRVKAYYNPDEKTEALPEDLLGYLDKYLELKKNDLATNTIKKINVIKQLLIRYQQQINKPLNLTDINLNFKVDFEKYCLENNYAPNTIGIAFKFIKTICNHAKANGLEVSNQLINVKAKQTKVESIYLSFEELEKIQKAKLKGYNPQYEIARDWLIISCYTGQRISDFMRFTDKMVRVENGKSLIEFTQIKTGKIMTVPLHQKVLEILKKRKGKFPEPIVDQKYNLYIKEVCRIAKINEKVLGSLKTEIKEDSGIYRKETGNFEKYKLVTSHIGRRSFATNYYGKIPTTFLIYVTGHTTETMFLNYIGKSNKDIAMELTKYF